LTWSSRICTPLSKLPDWMEMLTFDAVGSSPFS